MVIDVQSRLMIVTQENERLTQTIETRNREFSALTQRLGELDGITRNMNLLQERVNTLTSENRYLAY
jgi:hypothetical protein